MFVRQVRHLKKLHYCHFIVLVLYLNIACYFMTEYFIYEKGHAHLTVQERPAQEIFEINRPKIRHKLEDTESIKVSSQQLRKQKNSASDDMTYEEATEYSSLLSATRNELLGKSLTGDDVVYKPSSTMHSRGKSSTEDKMIHKSASGRSAVWKDNKKGKVNVYLWEAVCPSPENDKVLHWHPLFPKYPTYSYLLENLDDPDWIIKKVARRIIGYLHPKITGHYEFQINSRDDMELFLYNGQWFEGQTAIIKMGIYAADRAEQDKIIGQYDLFSKTSDSVFLEKGKKYAIEIFHGIINFGRMNVRWKLQNGKNDFEIINSSYISSLYSNQTLNVDMPVPKFAPINKLDKYFRKDPRIRFHEYFPFSGDEISNNLPSCDYEPSYIIKETIKPDWGITYVYEDLIYPDNYLNFKVNASAIRKLNEKTAEGIAMEYFKSLQNQKSSSLQFSKIAHVEENRENLKGKRYFLEIDVVNITSKEKLRISNYVYKPSKDEPLCSPKDYRWDKSVKIYLLTPVRNQFKWIRYHLENINHIIRTVNDNNLHLIVMDFNSTDGNITELLKNSNINYTLINMDGPFNKVVALNKAASGIDDESIVFVLDLHLEIPLHLFDQVRKHTIKGKTAYSPILLRLYCGEHPEYTKLHQSTWMNWGYGMISLYKSDWDKIGGMNEEKFKNKWGGEDWEFLDRVLMAQYEVIHQKLPRFYHHYHSTKGTWDGTKIF